MDIEAALRAYLLTKTALTALISTRIYPDDISDGAALPCVVYLKVSDIPDYTHDGISSLRGPTIQFSAYATTKAAARSISKQIKAALCDFAGTLSGVRIQYIKLINELSSLETLTIGKAYVEDLEFEVIYEE